MSTDRAAATPFARTIGPGSWCSCGERKEITEDCMEFCPVCDNREAESEH